MLPDKEHSHGIILNSIDIPVGQKTCFFVNGMVCWKTFVQSYRKHG